MHLGALGPVSGVNTQHAHAINITFELGVCVRSTSSSAAHDGKRSSTQYILVLTCNLAVRPQSYAPGRSLHHLSRKTKCKQSVELLVDPCERAHIKRSKSSIPTKHATDPQLYLHALA